MLGKSRGANTVSQLNINGIIERDETTIANKFNTFFTNIGIDISNSVPNVAVLPESWVGYDRLIPDMRLGNTTPEHIVKTIKKNFTLKTVVIARESPRK